MKFITYEAQTMETWGGYNRKHRAHIGLFEETGELAGKIKKFERGDKMDLPADIAKEAGDCYYYATRVAAENHIELDENVFGFEKSGNEDVLLNELAAMSARILAYDVDNKITRLFLRFHLTDYITALNSFVKWFGLDPVGILVDNGAKLADRKKRGVIKGSGDDR